MKNINYIFCLIILFLLGFNNSMVIPKKETNSNYSNNYKNKRGYNIEFSEKVNNNKMVSTNEKIIYDSDKSIEKNVHDNFALNKEKNIKVNSRSSIAPKIQQDSNTYFVGDESVFISPVNQSSNNNSTPNKSESNQILNDLNKPDDIINNSLNSSDYKKFNSTEVLIGKIKSETIKDSDSSDSINIDKADSADNDILSEENTREKEDSLARLYKPDIVPVTNIDDNSIDNSNKDSNTENNKDLSGEKNLIYASGMIMGIVLFFIIGNIIIKVKKPHNNKDITLPGSRTLKLDRENFDSVNIIDGDLNSILSLETMEQYSDNNQVYVVDEKNNLKNITKIYEIKGYKDHIFERSCDVERSDSLNSLFDISFNENNSYRS
ncbi:hypothetical protein BCR36DRAFT_415481 [Piromyces finnis]|uniref:Uncharacterized protein n=1 Tax=Piromyces finnis TaxID=1754191 RepID=A0A1Y1UZ05_9FUNG|nr:hypothetical protein BCR36DRAFT_415481 [Piromyces finnis]|eukprot:ORX43638.1 hypothetical protein BCR36DRAFT_415481 [Piromyces finnis]